jgi:hypothetical protein
LIHGGAVVKFDITYGSDCKLDIVISEGIWERDIKEPMQVDLKRLVLLSSMLMVLTSTVSLSIQPSVKLDIHNQCPNTYLVLPAYVTGVESACHRPPDHDVCAGDTTRSAFIVHKVGSWSYAIPVYRLQRRKPHASTEIDGDTSIATHLLVVWRITGSKKLYADVLLVEHEKRFDWGKDDLKDLYRKNINQFRLSSVPVIETWLLGDDTILKTKFETTNGQLLNVTIYEAKRDNHVRIPAHIEVER